MVAVESLFTKLIYFYLIASIAAIALKINGYYLIYVPIVIFFYYFFECYIKTKSNNLQEHNVIHVPLIIVIFLVVWYGVIYGYPLLSGSWYSEDELNEGVTKKILKGMILWLPLMLALKEKKITSDCVVSLIFSILTANRTYPLIWVIVAIGLIRSISAKISAGIVILMVMGVITSIKIDSSSPTEIVLELVKRVADIEFEGLIFIFSNLSEVKFHPADEILRYFSSADYLLLAQEVALMQRGLDLSLYDKIFGAPTITIIGYMGTIVGAEFAPFFALIYVLGFVKFTKNYLKKSEYKIAMWVFLIYSLRNGAIIPPFIGVAMDMVPSISLLILLSLFFRANLKYSVEDKRSSKVRVYE